jgi:hypothetical protein
VGQNNILELIMNHSDHKSLIHQWERIICREDSIPSLQMIDEMIFPPNLDLNLIGRILSNYFIPDDINLYPIITESKKEELYSNVTEKILNSGADKKVYAYLLLQQYRSTQVETSLNSYCTILAHSGIIIRKLSSRPDNEILIRFCTENNINYSQYMYNRFVVDYCTDMLPYPLRHIRGLDGEYSMREVIPGMFFDAIKGINQDIPFPGKIYNPKEDNNKKEVFLRKLLDTEQRIGIRFSEYQHARKYIHEIDFRYPEELAEYHRERFDGFHESVTEKGRRKRKKQDKNKPDLLCQCQFCYSYRVEKKSTKRPAWHCGEDSCKDNYKAWGRKLLRNGIEIESLYD